MPEPRRWRANLGLVAPGIGTFTFAETLRWNLEAQRLAGKDLAVTVALWKNKRSDPQNRRHWKAIVKFLMDEINRNRPIDQQVTKESLHGKLCERFIGTIDTPLGPVRKSSADLDTAEFSKFNADIEEWIWHEMQIRIPEGAEDREDEW